MVPRSRQYNQPQLPTSNTKLTATQKDNVYDQNRTLLYAMQQYKSPATMTPQQAYAQAYAHAHAQAQAQAEAETYQAQVMQYRQVLMNHQPQSQPQSQPRLEAQAQALARAQEQAQIDAATAAYDFADLKNLLRVSSCVRSFHKSLIVAKPHLIGILRRNERLLARRADEAHIEWQNSQRKTDYSQWENWVLYRQWVTNAKSDKEVEGLTKMFVEWGVGEKLVPLKKL